MISLVNTESMALEICTPLVPKLDALAAKDGFMKVQLTFLTDEPKHIRSLMMQQIYNSKPPFVEDVCVLFPCDETFSILETFLPVFERLQEAGVVSPTANLQGFKVLDEDTQTLAYSF